MQASVGTPRPGVPNRGEQVANWLKEPLDQLLKDDASNLMLNPGSIGRLVDLASRREQCDWGLPWREEGFNTVLPHLSQLRAITSELALKARLEIAQGKFDEAVHTLQTGTAMARHLNQQAFLVQALVATAVQTLMLEQVDTWIGQKQSPNLYWALAQLPSPFIDARNRCGWNARRFTRCRT